MLAPGWLKHFCSGTVLVEGCLCCSMLTYFFLGSLLEWLSVCQPPTSLLLT